MTHPSVSEDILKESLSLVERSGVVMIGSNDPAGYPNIKAMFKMETEGLKTVWLSTNTSSKRVAQFLKDPKACLYFVDTENFKGLMLTGEMEVLDDLASRQRMWRDGAEIYYPLGVTDPDYAVLRFTARSGNYYHGLQNVTFAV